jgi:endonuclease/exonuclease/phosphatase family metal-dependent hydrolase
MTKDLKDPFFSLLQMKALCLALLFFSACQTPSGENSTAPNPTQPSQTLGVSPNQTVVKTAPLEEEKSSQSPGHRVRLNDITLMSWNVLNLGDGKDADEMAVIAKTIRESGAELVALQEVVGTTKGALAVNRLLAILNGDNPLTWEARTSPPTNANVAGEIERYAFLWKPASVTPIGNFALADALDAAISREPYVGTFVYKWLTESAKATYYDTFTVATLHTLPDNGKKDPRPEVRALAKMERLYPSAHLIVCGDVNLSDADGAWQPMREAGFMPAFKGQPTTLKMKPSQTGQLLANPKDNLWYEKAELGVESARIVPFHEAFPSLELARRVSDHVPIVVEVFRR